MVASLPSNIGYGKVVGRFLLAVADGPDMDRFPDGNPAKGKITFTPSPSRLLNVTATPPVTIIPKPIECTLDEEGYLTDPEGARGVWLIATDDKDNNPADWPYKVDIALEGVPRWTFHMELPEDTTLDLTTVLPVPTSTGKSITRGERGPAGPAGGDANMAGVNPTHLWEPPTQPAGEPLRPWDGDKIINDLWEPLRAADPTYVSRQVIGTSEGTPSGDIWAYTFAPPSYENTILLFNIHGNEKVNMYAVNRFMDLLVNEWMTTPRLAALRAQTRIVVVPVAGYYQSYSGSRKNANGVDLARNWDYKWEQYSETNPESVTYKGPSAFSESETQALRDLALSLEVQGGFTAAFDVHDTGESRKSDPWYFYANLPDNALTQPTWFTDLSRSLVNDPDKAVSLGSNGNPQAHNWFQARGIHSATIEYEQSWGPVGIDSENQTAALRIVGNIILTAASATALEIKKAEPFTRQMIFGAGSSQIILPEGSGSAGLGELAELRFEFVPPGPGIVVVTGYVLIGGAAGTYLVNPALGQSGTLWQSNVPRSENQTQLTLLDGSSQSAVPFTISRGVMGNPEWEVVYSLWMACDADVSVALRRYNATLTFYPADAPGRFENWSAYGRGGDGAGAMQFDKGI